MLDLRGHLSSNVDLQLAPGFEYVPINPPYYLQVYNTTESDSDGKPKTYVFGSTGSLEHRNSSLNVFPYPLLLAAYQPLYDPSAPESDRIRKARTEVTDLVDLYRRKVPPSKSLKGRPVMANLKVQRDPSEPPPNISDNTLTTPATPVAFQSGTVAAERVAAVKDQGPESDIRVPTDRSNGGSRDEEPVQVATEDLVDDDGDTIVTPAVLSSRLRWRDGPFASGSMRFATSSHFITNPEDN